MTTYRKWELMATDERDQCLQPQLKHEFVHVDFAQHDHVHLVPSVHYFGEFPIRDVLLLVSSPTCPVRVVPVQQQLSQFDDDLSPYQAEQQVHGVCVLSCT
jgi:hypothetical protein